MATGHDFRAGGPDRLRPARRDLLERIEEVRKALEGEEDPEEAAGLALLLTSLEDEERLLGSGEGAEILL